MKKRTKKVDQKQFDDVRDKTLEYRDFIIANYPDKSSAEYTRLVDDLKQFLSYGKWEVSLDD